MIKNICSVLIMASLALACASCGGNNKQNVSTGVGAGAGAVAGGLISSSPAGVLAGAAIGAALGSVVGSNLSEQDRKYVEDSIQVALDTAYKNKYYKWVNSSTGTTGEIVLIESYTNAHKQACGNFTEYLNIHGNKHKIKINACKQNGKWHMMK